MMNARTILTLAAYIMVGACSRMLAQGTVADTVHRHQHQHQHVHDGHGSADSMHHLHAQGHMNHTGHTHIHDHGHSHDHNEWSVGAVGTYAVHDAQFNSLPPVENCCTGFDKTEGTGFGVQVAFTTPISNDGWYLTPRLSYQSLPAAFESYSTEKAFMGDVTSGDALFRHTLDVDWSILNAGLSAEYAVAHDRIWLGFGLEGLFMAAGAYRQTETLEQPTNLVFETGTRVRLDRNGYLRDFASMVFNATGSLRLRIIPRRQSAGLDVFVRYSHPLMPVFAPQTWDGIVGNPPRAFFIDQYRMTMFTAGVALVL